MIGIIHCAAYIQPGGDAFTTGVTAHPDVRNKGASIALMNTVASVLTGLLKGTGEYLTIPGYLAAASIYAWRFICLRIWIWKTGLGI